MVSPYKDIKIYNWKSITTKLVDSFPIKKNELKECVEKAFDEYLKITISSLKLQVGKDIFFPAQATGVIIDKLIGTIIIKEKGNEWKSGDKKSEKDVVNTLNDKYSFEIKTSSSKSGIFGNRSMGHRSEKKIKSRSGYYLVINYKLPKEDDKSLEIYKIRFGWIDDEDWKGQASPTGQQSTISKECKDLKLIEL